MNDFTPPLLLGLDVVSLTMSLVNIPSPTGADGALADAIEAALAPLGHLDIERIGSTVVARSRSAAEQGSGRERVLLTAHIDTVPGPLDELAYVEMGKLFGTGACDAKGALAVLLKAAMVTYDGDLTVVLHGTAEDGGTAGLKALAETRPELLIADVAVVLEPTRSRVARAGGPHPALDRLAGLVEPTTEPVATPPCSALDLLASLGLPTAAFGPGDPALAHTAGEFVPTAELTECEYVLRTWLKG
jgi:acetylornithine deacetylase/succinyl-diaminopimelate desuccinylase-like protein